MEADDDLKSLLSEQRRELTAAQALESDLLFAYQLQMQEAMNASLPQNGSGDVTGSSNPVSISDAVSEATTAQLLSDEISNYEQQLLDHEAAEAMLKKIQNDLNRRIHDHAFAREILNVPEEEWKEIGDEIQKPFVEGSALARGVSLNNEDSFRVYVKGLISEEAVGDEKRKILLAGIGVAICDMNDGLVLEVSKGVGGGEMSDEAVEVKALIESLNVVTMLGLKRITVVCGSNFLYQCVTGKWRPRESNLATLFDQVSVLQRKLTCCNLSLVGEKDVKFAFELARNAIVSQCRRPVENNGGKNIIEICAICLENTYADEMFLIDGCSHRYCFSCMKRHVELKLLLGILPKCPHEECKSELKIDDCRKFLTNELLEIMRQRIREDSIPPAEKIYCPYPTCSALMSISEFVTQGTSAKTVISARTCIKCLRRFCINCKVPWHDNMTCDAYQRLSPYQCPEDAKLKSLATKSLWQQCVKCKHMVSLVEGCNHIYCRCGHEFCYVCGAEWKNKKATCSCCLWDERNIIYDGANPHQRRRG